MDGGFCTGSGVNQPSRIEMLRPVVGNEMLYETVTIILIRMERICL